MQIVTLISVLWPNKNIIPEILSLWAIVAVPAAVRVIILYSVRFAGTVISHTYIIISIFQLRTGICFRSYYYAPHSNQTGPVGTMFLSSDNISSLFYFLGPPGLILSFVHGSGRAFLCVQFTPPFLRYCRDLFLINWSKYFLPYWLSLDLAAF